MVSFLPFEGTQISYRHCGRTSVEEEEEEESMSMSMSSRMEARKTHTKGRERNQRKQLFPF